MSLQAALYTTSLLTVNVRLMIHGLSQPSNKLLLGHKSPEKHTESHRSLEKLLALSELFTRGDVGPMERFINIPAFGGVPADVEIHDTTALRVSPDIPAEFTL